MAIWSVANSPYDELSATGGQGADVDGPVCPILGQTGHLIVALVMVSTFVPSNMLYFLHQIGHAKNLGLYQKVIDLGGRNLALL